ncbi:MAG: response regulator [Planctomycetes bacterium]|nr:response regulator [Planctomycetota bacterium]
MTYVLVVEDSPTQALEVEWLLEQSGFEVTPAQNGVDALRIIAVGRIPDLILTDLDMPEMNGLELIQEIRKKHPLVPVILMTAFGSEEIALRALKEGAASYVPKRNLSRDLVKTVETVLTAANAKRRHQHLLDCLIRTESHFLLENDPGLIPALIGHVSENLLRMKICRKTGLVRVSVALTEALEYAIFHGNLEVNPELREENETAYQQLIEERRQQPPYRDRRVHVSAKESLAEAVYVVRDEGPGLDLSKLPDPPGPVNLEKVSGRGLVLMRTFMDEVWYNRTGNELTLIKRRQR